MKRREFITLLGGAVAAWPITARAQQPERMRRIGMLSIQAEADPDIQARLDGFRHGLQALGWVEGRNLHIDYRFADGRGDRVQPLAKELIALKPELIFAQGTPVVAVLQRESRTLPVVFVNVSDPIGSGFVASLARPGDPYPSVLRHEVGHCNGWGEDHKGGRSFGSPPGTAPGVEPHRFPMPDSWAKRDQELQQRYNEWLRERELRNK